MERIFGRIPSLDARDAKFLMQRKLAQPSSVTLPVNKVWNIAPRSLDQGPTSCCVGFAWSNFLRCAPMQTVKNQSPFDIYRKAVQLDEWPENNSEATLPDGSDKFVSGTSVRAGAEAVTAEGRLKSYLWAFTLSPVIEWVLTRGPVVLGVNWYSSFDKPNADGIARITPQASVVGGHAFLMRGANTKRSLALFENSWGDGWGRNGMFYLPFADLERLIYEKGEVCTAIEQKLSLPK